jgi:hypothetical protein
MSFKPANVFNIIGQVDNGPAKGSKIVWKSISSERVI